MQGLSGIGPVSLPWKLKLFAAVYSPAEDGGSSPGDDQFVWCSEVIPPKHDHQCQTDCCSTCCLLIFKTEEDHWTLVQWLAWRSKYGGNEYKDGGDDEWSEVEQES